MALNQYNEPPWEGVLEASKNSSVGLWSRLGRPDQVFTQSHQRSRTRTQITGRVLPRWPHSDGTQGDPVSNKMGKTCSSLAGHGAAL